MQLDELKVKASALPMLPGVYIMKDINDAVIYVGKAKKLKNRVTQYFQDNISHTPKTRLMVSKVDHFEVIVAASEFEALVLESSLIKRYMPKYNILLKDDKGYPFLRLDSKATYPKITMVSKMADDNALYFGPYGSRGVTQSLLDALLASLKLPNCSKVFPRDIGKGRLCLRYHMNQCDGWCQKKLEHDAYVARIEQAQQMLRGNYKIVASEIRQQMLSASENLNFELAASLRDMLKSIEALGQKQLVTAGVPADTDVFGFYQNSNKACLSALHFQDGNLLDKEYEIFSVIDEPAVAISSLITQYYANRGYAPKYVYLPFPIEDSVLVEEFLKRISGCSTKLIVPQRGDKYKMVELAIKNAVEEVNRITSKEEKTRSVLNLIASMLNIPIPNRIESYDISNLSGTDVVASMVVYVDGKPKKSEYKKFAIRDLEQQDDYASMYQVLMRRFQHLLDEDSGFSSEPGLLLIDGGVEHAQVALRVLRELNLAFPVFGMVKDDKHRTRALVTAEGLEIAIDTQPSVFSFVGTIQEETHRFAINYHRQLRSKRLRYSELDTIPGIGVKRKEELLRTFKSISAIKSASIAELERILPSNAASAVYNHFHGE